MLHALAGDIARDRRIGALARELVDLVDVDDPLLGPGDVEVGGLDQPQEDVLDVLADIPGLGQRGGVDDGERHVEDAGHRLREQRLAGARRSDEEDVALLDLDVLRGGVGPDALVVVVDGHAQHALGAVLADDVLVQARVDLLGGEPVRGGHRLGRGRRALFGDDLLTEVDALVADEDASRSGDQSLDVRLRLPAEGADLIGSRRRRAGVGGHGPTSPLAQARSS